MNGKKEPIAVIGMGCRFPGAENPKAFWELLCAGKEAIQEIPEDRWDLSQLYNPDPGQPGKIMSRWAGLLRQVDQFDWRAFRLLPKDARHMDPQHRLLHEVTWEALEDAGIPFDRLAGSNTSVFIGIGWSDYLRLLSRNWSHIDGYASMGNANCFAANRLSYLFDLQGPSMALDAGCSSSLAALYAGCQSLWSGEANITIVGGVNVLLSPDASIMLSKAGLLSPDGHCRTLDAQADGFVRGEGAGVIILKPASSIQQDDRVYALIRNVQVHHNGHNEWIISSSQKAQEKLLRHTYEQIGISSQDIDYIELHGTGFLRGDAIEVNAIASVLAEQDTQRSYPCLIGSVKTNIGHLEAASGMASLIKGILAIHHRTIPPTINVREVNPALPLTEHRLTANYTLRAWPEKQEPIRAGITTLAFTGAIAHAVVEEFPIHKELSFEDVTEQQLHLLLISARTKEALQANAVSFLTFLQEETKYASEVSLSWSNICYTAAVRRTHHEYRLAFLAQNQAEATSLLHMFTQGQTHTRISSGKALAQSHQKLTFLFAHKIPTSIINQVIAFSQKESTFQQHLEKCDQLFQIYAHISPLEELLITKSMETTKSKYVSLPLLFTLQTALAATWNAWGIISQTVIGEGNGKIAASFYAGLVSIQQVLASICSLLDISGELEALQNTNIQANRLAINNTATFYSIDNETFEVEQLVQDRPQEYTAPTILPETVDQIIANGNSTFLEMGPPTGIAAAFLARLEHQERKGAVYTSLHHGEDPHTTYLQIAGHLYTQGHIINWPIVYHETGHQLVSLPTYQWQRERLWPDWLDIATISTSPENILPSIPKQNQQDHNTQIPSLLSKLEQVKPEERQYLLQRYLVEQVRKLLDLDKQYPIKVGQKLFALGMDSMTATQLRYHLQSTLNRPLPATLLFNYPTIGSLSDYLLHELYPPVHSPTKPKTLSSSLDYQGNQQKKITEALSDEETEILLFEILEALEESEK